MNNATFTSPWRHLLWPGVTLLVLIVFNLLFTDGFAELRDAFVAAVNALQ